MELLFLGAFLIIVVATGLWKLILPIFAIWFTAFLIVEHRSKTASQPKQPIYKPVISVEERRIYPVNYFGPVW